MSSFFISLFSLLLFFLSGLMILLVLIQRGRGGGLAGAFGGQGGQSALGVRAGDVFTKITVVMAICWVLLCGGLGIAMRGNSAAEKETTNLNLPSKAETEDDTNAPGDDSPGTPITAPDFDDTANEEEVEPADTSTEPADAEPADAETTDGEQPAAETPAADDASDVSEDAVTPEEEAMPAEEKESAAEEAPAEEAKTAEEAETDKATEAEESAEDNK